MMSFKIKFLDNLFKKYSIRVWSCEILSSDFCSLRNKLISEAESETRYTWIYEVALRARVSRFALCPANTPVLLATDSVDNVTAMISNLSLLTRYLF